MNYVLKSSQALGKVANSHQNANVMRESLFCDEKFVWVSDLPHKNCSPVFLKLFYSQPDSFRKFVNICIILRQYFVLYFFGGKAFLWLNVIYFKGILEKVSIPNFFVNLETEVINFGCRMSFQAIITYRPLHPYDHDLFRWILFFYDCGASFEPVHTRQKLDVHHDCGMLWWPNDNDWQLNTTLIYEVNVCLYPIRFHISLFSHNTHYLVRMRFLLAINSKYHFVFVLFMKNRVDEWRNAWRRKVRRYIFESRDIYQ